MNYRRCRGLLACLAALPSAAAQPLALTPAPPARVSLFQPAEFTGLAAGDPLAPWRGGRVVTDEGGCLLLTKQPGAEARLRYDRTVRVDLGTAYTFRVEYQTDIDGAYLAINDYAFYTWGDTVRVSRPALPPSPMAYQTIEIAYTPAPGTICAGVWIALPPASQGVFKLRRCEFTGPAWGGVDYPAFDPGTTRDQAWWSVIDKVVNSVPVNTVYYGPGAQNEFPLVRGRGTGTPWVPIGCVVPAGAGTCTVGVEARQPSGGAVLQRWSGQVEAPADRPPAARLELTGLDRPAQVELAAWNAAGELVGRRSLFVRFQQPMPHDHIEPWDGGPAAAEPWPGGGRVGIELPGELVRDWSSRPLTAKLLVTAGPAATLTVRVERWDRHEVASQTTELQTDQAATIPLTFTAPNPDVYDVIAKLTAGDRVLDERTLRLGLRDPQPSRPYVAPHLPRMLRSEEMHFSSLRNAPQADQQYRAWLTELQEHGSNTAGIGCYLTDFCPLPGVYRFAELDHQVELARQAGLQSLLYFRLHRWPEWAGWESPLDQNGQPDSGVSAASAGVRQVVAEALHALAAHYRGDPDVVGYNRWNCQTDWTYRDTYTRHFDYGPSALALWREISGGQTPPVPLEHGPDLRPEWRRWSELRREIISKWQVESLGEAIRSVDPKRWIFCYMMAGGHADMEAQWPDFLRLGMIPAHGGSDSRDVQRHLELARERGLVYRHESVSAPDRHPLQADLTIFHGLFGGILPDQPSTWNIAWNIGWNTTHDNAGVKSALQRRKRLLEVVAEMQAGGFDRTPCTWAQFSSWDDLCLGGRSFQWHNLVTELELGDMWDNRSHGAVSDRTPLEQWQRYKLVYSQRPKILTPETVQTIRRYVTSGGTFVLVLYPAEGQQLLAKELLGLALPAEAGPKRTDAVGRAPWFEAGRRLVIQDRLDVKLQGQPLAATADGSPVAWDVSLGKGHLLVFAGPPNLADSRGLIDDLLNHLGSPRRFQLTSADPKESYPPEGLEFVDAGGDAYLWFHRAVRWNHHRQLISSAAKAAPTWDGYASVHPRVKVTAEWWPRQPGSYEVSRWDDGTWTSLGTMQGETITAPGLELGPGENGILRCRRVR